MIEKLLQLQKEIYRFETTDFDTQEEREYFVGYSSKVCFFPVGDFLDISFYGNGFDEAPNTKAEDFDYETNFAFCAFLDFICKQENAERLISLTFDGADEGANGTKEWNFSRIINSNVTFPNLKSLKIQLTDLGDHNGNIIGFNYEERGMIAKLMEKMPNLECLIIPSAPDKSFFEIGKHPLKRLVVQVGYDNQNFIENFAESDNFYQLTTLDFADLIGVQDTPFVSFETFEKLFKSKAFSTVKHFKLRNSILSEKQLFELQKLSNVQFLYIKAKGGQYVSHMMKAEK